MKQEIVEVKDYDLETVEDMIKALLQVPKGYTLHPLGQKCSLAVDHRYKCVYLDGATDIEIIKSEVEEEAKSLGEPMEIEVPNEELVVYNPKLYVVMGYLVSEIGEEVQCMGVFSTPELATECGDELVGAGVIEHYEVETPELDEFGYK